VKEVTGNVANNCKNILMLGRRLVRWESESRAEFGFGIVFWLHCCPHMNRSALIVDEVSSWRSWTYILAAFIIFFSSYIFKLAGISPSSGITSISLWLKWALIPLNSQDTLYI
jgi:hypothetical protein